VTDHHLPATPGASGRALTGDMQQLLEFQQKLLGQASAAADAVARQNVFTRYRHRKAEHTKRMHRAALGCFMRYLAEAGVPLTFHLADEPRLWSKISFGLVEGFMLWMEEKGYKIKTMNDYLSVVKLYAGLAHQAKMMSLEQLQEIDTIKSLRGAEADHIENERARRKLPPVGKKKAAATYLSPEEIRQLLTLPDNPQGKRDRVALLLLYGMGMRPGEVVALRLSDLHLAEGYYHVKRLKTYEEQELEFGADLAVALQEYLLERRDWAAYSAEPTEENDAPLLVQTIWTKQLIEQCDMGTRVQDGRYRKQKTGNGIPSADWSTQSMYTYIRRLSLRLGLPPLSPYDGRHQWAKDAADSGTNYIHLLQAGGWRPGSRMPDQYYGRHRVERTHVKLTVRETGGDAPTQNE
jgi:integrase